MNHIQVCTGNACKAKFSNYITQRLHNDINFLHLKNVEITESLCMNHCKKAPNININGKIEHYVSPVKASEELVKLSKKKTTTSPKK